jgi:acetoin utilization deacetylase AcuC-like enzyme
LQFRVCELEILILQRNMGDSEYVAAFLQVVLPVAYQFDPELVLISAGFDAAIKDPLGGNKHHFSQLSLK